MGGPAHPAACSRTCGPDATTAACSKTCVPTATTAAHLCAHEGGRHVLQLQRGQRGQLLVDALEDVVVQVPRLVQLRLLRATTRGARQGSGLQRARRLAQQSGGAASCPAGPAATMSLAGRAKDTLRSNRQASAAPPHLARLLVLEAPLVRLVQLPPIGLQGSGGCTHAGSVRNVHAWPDAMVHVRNADCVRWHMSDRPGGWPHQCQLPP